MENSIKIIHNIISFRERVKYYVLLFIFGISLMGLFFFFDKRIDDFPLFILIMAPFFGLLICLKIYKHKLFLAEFHSNSKKVKIVYFNINKEINLETTIEKISVRLKETTTRTNFNFELILEVDDIKLVIENTFNWSFTEMKNIFEYIRFHNKALMTDKEKYLIERIEEYIKKVPF